VKLAVSERAAKIVVVAAQIVTPLELIPGRADAPEIVGSDGDREDEEHSPALYSRFVGARHSAIAIFDKVLQVF
jgi:hypothetical protein